MYFYIVHLKGNKKPVITAAENKNEIISRFGSLFVSLERIDAKTAKHILNVSFQEMRV